MYKLGLKTFIEQYNCKVLIVGRHGNTKKKILGLISLGTDNLSEISKELGLAPSTVSKHLHDLIRSGFIVPKDSSQTKKWRYYQINPAHKSEVSAIADKAGKYHPMISGHKLITYAVVLFAIMGIAVYLHTTSAGLTYIPISITDPPRVPAGTQALYINYSSLSVHIHTNTGLEWVMVNSSGRLDLMGILNASQIIGEIGIKPNYSIDAAKFNITSASIKIDNITYPVAITNKQVASTVENKKRLNATSGLLLDLMPIVVPAYVNNSIIFVMLPSLSISIGRSPVFYEHLGSIGNIMYKPDYSIIHKRYPLMIREHFFLGRLSSLNISNASLELHKSQTSFRIMLHNSGDTAIIVQGIMLHGSMAHESMRKIVIAAGSAITYNQTNSSISLNASAICNGSTFNAGGGILIKSRASVNQIFIYNIRQCMGIGGRFADAMPAYLGFAFGFAVEGNRTLIPLQPPAVLGLKVPLGYTLQPGSSATFYYSGGPFTNGFAAQLQNDTYNVNILTSEGIAEANVTSS